jgi:hypothetical protein
MIRKILTGAVLAAILCLLGAGCQKQPTTGTRKAVLRDFKNPPSAYGSAPLWVWNDRISKTEIDEQLRDFHDKGIGGVFIHPRPGLITPYLSDEWLELCSYAVAAAKSLGMKIWIYDENSYPSGFAGGHVPAEMPDAIGHGLHMTRAKKIAHTLTPKPLLVLARQASGYQDITAQVGVKKFPAGDYYIFDLKEDKPSGWFGGFQYVDIMRKEVTEKFLQITLEAYKKTIGSEFGKTVPGSFQDEAHISPVGDTSCVNYTPRLFEAFQQKWGYDIRLHLPSLYLESGDWKRIRHNYYSTLLDLFIDNWAKPYAEWCAGNNMKFTGHYWEHEWPYPRMCPDNMALSAISHMPGIDILMNQWSMNPGSQFGNNRAVKEIRSAANQMGYERTMSETYGAGGWDLTYFDQKRIGDWEYALGVNFLNQHLSYVTIMGARKRDHPQSFSYHEPWWPAYKTLGDYFARLSVALSAGKQVNSILVLEPTTSAWMYYDRSKKSKIPETIGKAFQNFVNQLEAWQIEYDLGSEDILKRTAAVVESNLLVGSCKYDLIILPPEMYNLDSATAALLIDYCAHGGKILSWSIPRFVDGREDDRIAKIVAQSSAWRQHAVDGAAEEILSLQSPTMRFVGLSDTTLLFHHRRTLHDAELLFLVNSSDKQPVTGRIKIPKSVVEEWDPFTGEVKARPVVVAGKECEIEFNLAPAASLLLCVKPGRLKSMVAPSYLTKEIPAKEGLTIQRETANVLTLDYCDLTQSAKTERDMYFYEAQTKTFKANGLPANPWDSAVQYKTNIIDQDQFSEKSGFDACFWFTLAEGVDLASLQLVVERPRLWQVSVNDKPVTANPDQWWLDRAFGVYDIGQVVKKGKNKITLHVAKFTIHTELEAVYVRGNFNLQAEKKGFSITAAQPLHLGGWNKQGAPFYADGVLYSNEFYVSVEKGKLYKVSLPKWAGSYARVLVNDQPAGIIAFQPAELDVTGFVRNGINEVKVVVYGTLKNLLGPHHNQPKPGAAWPSMFQKGAKGGYPAGSGYDTYEYGLMEEFKLVCCTPQQ